MVKWTAGTFFREQCSSVEPVLHADLKEKSIIVVGANSGIGFETAKHFAKMSPSRLILACRNEEKGNQAVSAIEQTTGYRPELRLVDLTDFSSVVDFVAKLDGEPIDILVANAGIVEVDFKTTKDGWEETVQVNHLSAALLSFLLLPNMRRAAIDHNSISRVIVVTSELHHIVKFEEKLFEGSGLLHTLSDKEYSTTKVMGSRYFETKLLNVLFARAFAEHLTSSNPVIAISVNPGLCVSTIRRNLTGIQKIGPNILEWTIARTPEQGSRQVIFAALGPDGKEGRHVRHLNGAYVSCCSVVESSDWVISKEGYDAQEKIWAETIDILSKAAPSIRDILSSNA